MAPSGEQVHCSVLWSWFQVSEGPRKRQMCVTLDDPRQMTTEFKDMIQVSNRFRAYCPTKRSREGGFSVQDRRPSVPVFAVLLTALSNLEIKAAGRNAAATTVLGAPLLSAVAVRSKGDKGEPGPDQGRTVITTLYSSDRLLQRQCSSLSPAFYSPSKSFDVCNF